LPWLYLFINGVPSCSSSFIHPKAQIYNLTSNLTEKWKLHAKRMELFGMILLFYILPLIPNLIRSTAPNPDF